MILTERRWRGEARWTASKSIYLTLGDSIELDRRNPEGSLASYTDALHIIIITLTTIHNELAQLLARYLHTRHFDARTCLASQWYTRSGKLKVHVSV